jgi:hypothetical protein
MAEGPFAWRFNPQMRICADAKRIQVTDLVRVAAARSHHREPRRVKPIQAGEFAQLIEGQPPPDPLGAIKQRFEPPRGFRVARVQNGSPR